MVEDDRPVVGYMEPVEEVCNSMMVAGMVAWGCIGVEVAGKVDWSHTGRQAFGVDNTGAGVVGDTEVGSFPPDSFVCSLVLGRRSFVGFEAGA